MAHREAAALAVVLCDEEEEKDAWPLTVPLRELVGLTVGLADTVGQCEAAGLAVAQALLAVVREGVPISLLLPLGDLDTSTEGERLSLRLDDKHAVAVGELLPLSLMVRQYEAELVNASLKVARFEGGVTRGVSLGVPLALPLRNELALTLGDAVAESNAVWEASSDARALGLVGGEALAELVAASVVENVAVGGAVAERGPPTIEIVTAVAAPYTASPLWVTISEHVPPAFVKATLPVLNVPGRAPEA